MTRNRRTGREAEKGRRFYETSSPWETEEPTTQRPRTYTGTTDESPWTGEWRAAISGPEVMRLMQPEQYDNPRGYLGMAMITSGDEKSKLADVKHQHSISHHAEGEAKLTRTGK